MDAAHNLADRIGRQDPLAVRITKSVFHAPAEAHPLIDQLAQGILFESQAKFDRMQAFLDKKSDRQKQNHGHFESFPLHASASSAAAAWARESRMPS